MVHFGSKTEDRKPSKPRPPPPEEGDQSQASTETEEAHKTQAIFQSARDVTLLFRRQVASAERRRQFYSTRLSEALHRQPDSPLPPGDARHRIESLRSPPRDARHHIDFLRSRSRRASSQREEDLFPEPPSKSTEEDSQRLERETDEFLARLSDEFRRKGLGHSRPAAATG